MKRNTLKSSNDDSGFHRKLLALFIKESLLFSQMKWFYLGGMVLYFLILRTVLEQLVKVLAVFEPSLYFILFVMLLFQNSLIISLTMMPMFVFRDSSAVVEMYLCYGFRAQSIVFVKSAILTAVSVMGPFSIIFFLLWNEVPIGTFGFIGGAALAALMLFAFNSCNVYCVVFSRFGKMLLMASYFAGFFMFYAIRPLLSLISSVSQISIFGSLVVLSFAGISIVYLAAWRSSVEKCILALE